MFSIESGTLVPLTSGVDGLGSLIGTFLYGLLVFGMVPLRRRVLALLAYSIVWAWIVQVTIPVEQTQHAVFLGGLGAQVVACKIQPYTETTVSARSLLDIVRGHETDANPDTQLPERTHAPVQNRGAQGTPAPADDGPATAADTSPQPQHWTPDRMDLSVFEED